MIPSRNVSELSLRSAYQGASTCPATAAATCRCRRVEIGVVILRCLFTVAVTQQSRTGELAFIGDHLHRISPDRAAEGRRLQIIDVARIIDVAVLAVAGYDAFVYERHAASFPGILRSNFMAVERGFGALAQRIGQRAVE